MVAHGDEIKAKSTLAIGAFRVAFVTQDAAHAATRGVFGGSAAKIIGDFVGADRALMQKIADDVYADFLTQAGAKGLTVDDSPALAKASAFYAALAPSDNFGRAIGYLMIPTGQRPSQVQQLRLENQTIGLFDEVGKNAKRFGLRRSSRRCT